MITSNTDNSDLEYENKKQAGTIRAYQLALGRNLALLDTELTRLKSRVYASQIGALQQTIAARKLPLEVFLAEVQAFSALSDAKKAEYALVEAQISGDKAKTEGLETVTCNLP